jgi:hypothetical protein
MFFVLGVSGFSTVSGAVENAIFSTIDISHYILIPGTEIKGFHAGFRESRGGARGPRGDHGDPGHLNGSPSRPLMKREVRRFARRPAARSCFKAPRGGSVTFVLNLVKYPCRRYHSLGICTWLKTTGQFELIDPPARDRAARSTGKRVSTNIQYYVLGVYLLLIGLHHINLHVAEAC